MKIILAILLLFTIPASAQTYLRVSDKPEYAKYEQWCKSKVMKTVYQYGIYKVMRVDGQYSDSMGNYVAVNPIKIIWSAGTTSPEGRNGITLEPDERCMTVEMKIQAWRRYPSIADFYANWKTGLIKH